MCELNDADCLNTTDKYSGARFKFLAEVVPEDNRYKVYSSMKEEGDFEIPQARHLLTEEVFVNNGSLVVYLKKNKGTEIAFLFSDDKYAIEKELKKIKIENL